MQEKENGVEASWKSGIFLRNIYEKIGENFTKASKSSLLISQPELEQLVAGKLQAWDVNWSADCSPTFVTWKPTCARAGGNVVSQAHFAWANFCACWQHLWVGRLLDLATLRICWTWALVMGVFELRGYIFCTWFLHSRNESISIRNLKWCCHTIIWSTMHCAVHSEPRATTYNSGWHIESNGPPSWTHWLGCAVTATRYISFFNKYKF